MPWFLASPHTARPPSKRGERFHVCIVLVPTSSVLVKGVDWRDSGIVDLTAAFCLLVTDWLEREAVLPESQPYEG